MIYYCRRIRPNSEETWRPVEESSPGRAANEYHTQFSRTYNYVILDDVGKQRVYFALIEVKDHGVFTSRYFYKGIYRSGGIRLPGPTPAEKLRDIAAMLGYNGSPEELLAPGWDEEEEEWT